jgi:hypothetical protein
MALVMDAALKFHSQPKFIFRITVLGSRLNHELTRRWDTEVRRACQFSLLTRGTALDYRLPVVAARIIVHE